jgi:hypothetical protein
MAGSVAAPAVKRKNFRRASVIGSSRRRGALCAWTLYHCVYLNVQDELPADGACAAFAMTRLRHVSFAERLSQKIHRCNLGRKIKKPTAHSGIGT